MKETKTYTSNKVEEIKSLAAERGLTPSELLDRYVIIGKFLDKAVKEGKTIYAQLEGDSNRDVIPVEEFLEIDLSESLTGTD